MKADVVIPLSAASKGGRDFELRYSLRSLAAQEWVRDVYVIGHAPKWLANVNHVECPDPFLPKDANIINKILLAASVPGISQRFVVNSDDQYLMRPVTLDELGPWGDPGNYAHAKVRTRQSRWCRRLVETIDWCRENGHPTFTLDSHIPYLVDRDIYPRVMAKTPWKTGNGLVTHVYFNLTLSHTPVEPPLGLAVHATRPMRQAPDPVPAFFNHNDGGLSSVTHKWLEAMFPDPSPWEA